MRRVDRFKAEQFTGPVNPELWVWRGPKTMTVHYYGGSIRERAWALDLDENPLDCAGMDAALSEIWKQCKPLCDRRALFHHGGDVGCMSYVPHAAGEQAVAIIRAHFAQALERLQQRCSTVSTVVA